MFFFDENKLFNKVKKFLVIFDLTSLFSNLFPFHKFTLDLLNTNIFLFFFQIPRKKYLINHKNTKKTIED